MTTHSFINGFISESSGLTSHLESGLVGRPIILNMLPTCKNQKRKQMHSRYSMWKQTVKICNYKILIIAFCLDFIIYNAQLKNAIFKVYCKFWYWLMLTNHSHIALQQIFKSKRDYISYANDISYWIFLSSLTQSHFCNLQILISFLNNISCLDR